MMKRRLAVVALALACAFSTPAIARHRHHHAAKHSHTVTCNSRGCSDWNGWGGTARKVVKVAHARSRRSRNKVAIAEPVRAAFYGFSSAASVAESYVGHTPTVAELKSWARETGIGVWRHGVRVYCALGINKVFAETGIKGSGSASASSFRRWGSRTRDPRSGDVAIVGNHHVALVVGRSGGKVIVVSFNDYRHRILKREYPLRGIEYRTRSRLSVALNE